MEHRREDDMRIHVALRGGADDARENLLTFGAIPGPISATDLARHDDRSNRVFGAPVGGIDGRIK